MCAKVMRERMISLLPRSCLPPVFRQSGVITKIEVMIRGKFIDKINNYLAFPVVQSPRVRIPIHHSDHSSYSPLVENGTLTRGNRMGCVF